MRSLLVLLVVAGCSRGGRSDPLGDPPDLLAGSAVDLGSSHADLGGPSIWQTSGTRNTLRGIWGVPVSGELGSMLVFVVGDQGTILHGDGRRWSAVPSGTSATLHSVWAANATAAWAVGDGGTILRWNDAWRPQSSGTAKILRGVHGRGDQDVWFSGYDMTLLHWNGSSMSSYGKPVLNIPYDSYDTWISIDGHLWEVLDPHYPKDHPIQGGYVVMQHLSQPLSLSGAPMEVMWSIYGVTTHDVWTVGDNGSVFWWSDTLARGWGGEPRDSKVKSRLNDVFGLTPDDVWAVGNEGTVIHWDGNAWSRIPIGPAETVESGRNLNGVWAIGPKEALVVGQDGAIGRVKAP